MRLRFTSCRLHNLVEADFSTFDLAGIPHLPISGIDLLRLIGERTAPHR
jgi:hypothetical protein